MKNKVTYSKSLQFTSPSGGYPPLLLHAALASSVLFVSWLNISAALASFILFASGLNLSDSTEDVSDISS